MRRVLIAASLLLVAWASPLGAQSFRASTDIEVPGGRAGVADVLGMGDPPPRAVFIPELARHIYSVPEGKSVDSDRQLAVLAAYLEGVDRFYRAIAAVQPAGGTISLLLATDRNGRKRLRDFLDLLGLVLREKSGAYSVEPLKEKDLAARAPLLQRLGIEPVQIAKRLNAGEAVRVEPTAERVPLALDPVTWSTEILEEKLPPDRLFARVMGDPRAALLAHGLAWLDDETLQYLARTRGLLRRLYRDHPPTFAAFGRSLRVSRQKVVVPGGPAAESLWEAVVDEKVTRADRFIRTLLDKHDGRLAYFYDVVASLDAPHAQFALGMWIEEPALRLDRFRALEATAREAFPALQPKVWPFTRPPSDIGLLLARVRVRADGAPLPPNARKLWERVFQDTELSDDPPRDLRGLEDAGAIDAAWLAAQILTPARTADRTARLDTLVFGQRVFGAGPAPDVLNALRGFAAYRTLMLTLDRMGVTEPALYVEAARRAASLGTLEDKRAYPVLAQFQSSLALLARLHAVRSLDDTRARTLLRELFSINLADGRYGGALARWIDRSLLPSLPAVAEGNDEARLLHALAGVDDSPAPPRTIVFEERTYRLDLPGAELQRLGAVRQKQRGYDLSQVLAFTRAVRQVEDIDATSAPGAVQAAVEALKRTGAPFTRDKVPPAPGDEAPDPQDVLSKELRDLAKITKPKDLRRARDSAAPLHAVADALLARTLLSLTYALALGDPGGTVLLGVDPSRRHDFGLAEKDDRARKQNAWLLPVEQHDVGVPWHVLGSALALDVGLSRLALRRVASDHALDHPGAFNLNHQRTFMQTAVLLDPRAMSDTGRDEMAAGIARGRARVAAATDAAALEALAAGAHSLAVDGLRRRGLRWTLANEPTRVGEWLSMIEILTLGTPNLEPRTLNLEPGTLNLEPGTLNPSTWGMASLAFDSCLCTQLHVAVPWQVLAGQTSLGVLPMNMADVNLRIAEITAEMQLPASLAPAILSAAVQAFLDAANPSNDDDWLSMLRTAQDISRQDVEDYMAALTANGTLVPHDSIRAPRSAPR